jgi:hypothetical protein
MWYNYNDTQSNLNMELNELQRLIISVMDHACA